MSRLGRIALLILLSLLFIQVLIGFPISLEHSVEPSEIAQAEEHVEGTKGDREHEMGTIHVVEGREGNRDWELFAEQAMGSENQGNLKVTDVKVHFYSKGRLEFVVTGKTGQVDTKTKDIKIFGDVVTRASNGYLFKAEEVDYEAASRMLRSPGKVKVFGPKDTQDGDLSLEGGSLAAQVDEGFMTVKPQVVAKRTISGSRSFIVRSGGAKLSRIDSSVEFFDQVVIEIETMRIEGPKARFVYRNKSDLLQSVLFQGGVKVSDIDKYATSEQVRFDPEQNQFVLTGRPRVVQNQDEIVGEQIIFLDGGKRVKVEKMRARVEETP